MPPSIRIRLGVPALALAIAVAVPGRAAVQESLDAYTLFAASKLSARRLRLRGGDVGVNDGALRVRATLDARDSQVVASEVRLGRGSRCAALYANAGRAARACGPAVAYPAPAFSDLRDACGFPDPFPSCDPDRSVTVRAGRTVTLDPGVRGTLTIRGRGRVTLAEAGRYVFCGIRGARRSTLTIEAPVEIDVLNEAVLGTVRFTGTLPGSPYDSAIGAFVAGEDETPIDVQLFVWGSRVRLQGPTDLRLLCAPSAALRVATAATLSGRFVARTLSGATVVAEPSRHVPTPTTTTTVPEATTTTTTSTTDTTGVGGTTTTAASTTTTTQPPDFVKSLGTTGVKTSAALTELTLAQGVAAGNSVVVALAMNPQVADETVAVSCSDTKGNAYTVEAQVVAHSGSETGVRTVVCAAHHLPAGKALAAGDRIRVSHPATQHRALAAVELRNLAGPGTPLDRTATAHSTGSGTATPSAGPTATTTKATEILVGAIGVDLNAATTITAAGGWTKAAEARISGSGTNPAVAVLYRKVAAAGAYSTGATLSTTRRWAATITTYR